MHKESTLKLSTIRWKQISDIVEAKNVLCRSGMWQWYGTKTYQLAGENVVTEITCNLRE